VNKVVVSAVRIIVLAVLASAVGFLMIWKFDLPAKFHSCLLGGFALVFAIADAYFSSVLLELNEILRRESYSVWQIEQLNQVIPNIRKMVWQLWGSSMFTKAMVGVVVAFLLLDDLSPMARSVAVFLGYSFLALTLFLSWWSRKMFKHVQSICDKIAAKEVERKESNRLKSEMAAGPDHDFKKDGLLKSYQKPAI
jgi:hypothetical protein